VIAFLAHVRRGGYAADLKDPAIKKQLDGYRAAMRVGNEPPILPILRTERIFAERE